MTKKRGLKKWEIERKISMLCVKSGCSMLLKEWKKGVFHLKHWNKAAVNSSLYDYSHGVRGLKHVDKDIKSMLLRFESSTDGC